MLEARIVSNESPSIGSDVLIRKKQVHLSHPPLLYHLPVVDSHNPPNQIIFTHKYFKLYLSSPSSPGNFINFLYILSNSYYIVLFTFLLIRSYTTPLVYSLFALYNSTYNLYVVLIFFCLFF